MYFKAILRLLTSRGTASGATRTTVDFIGATYSVFQWTTAPLAATHWTACICVGTLGFTARTHDISFGCVQISNNLGFGLTLDLITSALFVITFGTTRATVESIGAALGYQNNGSGIRK